MVRVCAHGNQRSNRESDRNPRQHNLVSIAADLCVQCGCLQSWCCYRDHRNSKSWLERSFPGIDCCEGLDQRLGGEIDHVRLVEVTTGDPNVVCVTYPPDLTVPSLTGEGTIVQSKVRELWRASAYVDNGSLVFSGGGHNNVSTPLWLIQAKPSKTHPGCVEVKVDRVFDFLQSRRKHW